LIAVRGEFCRQTGLTSRIPVETDLLDFLEGATLGCDDLLKCFMVVISQETRESDETE
jgi:hypothetical protein